MYKYRMKVIEVVTTNEIVGKAIGGLARLAVPIEKFKSAGQYATTAATKSGAMRVAAIDNKYLLKVPLFGRSLYNSRIKDAAKAFELAKANQAAVQINNLGAGMMNIMSILGIGGAVLDYYAASTVIEQSNLSPEEKEKKLDELRGILTLKVIGVGLISKTAQIGTVMTRILPGVMRFMPGTALPKLGIAGSEAINFLLRIGAGGLAGIFATEKGTAIIRDFVAGWIINGIGWVAGGAVTFVKEAYEYAKAGVKYAQGQRPEKKNDEKETDSSSPGADSAATAAKGLMDPDMSISDLAAKKALQSMGLGSK